ncbi:MAG: c-type cytochrome biogenesis protein CcsB [Rothia sp. (in: high G+C Gram-positive bacteria)]|nr:c-type cytochrome biogenesis protein CcsB [Rothia sp. (in: high G+C Gram-positive bacteria)]
MINQALAQWSDLFMYLAAISYTLAFLAFTWDVASHSRTTARLEGRQASSDSRDKEPVAATAASHQGAGSVRLASAEQGTGARGMAYQQTAQAQLAEHVADPSMRWGSRSEQSRPAARVAVAMLVIGLIIHAGAVLCRGLAAQRVPWGNMYEFCTTGAFVVTLIYLITIIFRDLRFVGMLVSGLAVIMMCAATIAFPTPVGHLKPALQSYWLVIHVSIAVLASAVFTITFAMALLQLLQTRREKEILAGKDGGFAFLRLVPSAQALENFAFRLNAVGFVLWTFTLAAGAIWAEKAWGRYWGWDTKEVWTFVIWVVYAAYLHARATMGWSGPRSAWLSIIGYLCIIFNFTVINIFFSGLHSYSGL